MMKFGKKITFRPLIISLVISLPIGFSIGSGLGVIPGFCLGLLFFLIMYNGYYYSNVPALFSYWEFDGQSIKYANFNDPKSRLLMMSFPIFLSLKQIDIKQISSMELIGANNKRADIQSMIPLSTAYGIFYARISMIKNPLELRVVLNSKETIDLDLSRDYTYKSKETLKKVSTVMDEVNREWNKPGNF